MRRIRKNWSIFVTYRKSNESLTVTSVTGAGNRMDVPFAAETDGPSGFASGGGLGTSHCPSPVKATPATWLLTYMRGANSSKVTVLVTAASKRSGHKRAAVSRSGQNPDLAFIKIHPQENPEESCDFDNLVGIVYWGQHPIISGQTRQEFLVRT